MRWKDRKDALCMKNIENADRPKSAIAIFPPRPFRGSGKVAQMAFKPARRDGKSFIPMVDHFFGDSGISKFKNSLLLELLDQWRVCFEKSAPAGFNAPD